MEYMTLIKTDLHIFGHLIEACANTGIRVPEDKKKPPKTGQAFTRSFVAILRLLPQREER